MENWVELLKEVQLDNKDYGRMDLYYMEKLKEKPKENNLASSAMKPTSTGATEDSTKEGTDEKSTNNDHKPQQDDQKIEDDLNEFKRNHASVVMVVRQKNVIDNKKGSFEIASDLLKNREVSYQYKLHEEISFASQRSAYSSGSGFFYKISKNQNYGVIITAAHNVIGVERKIEDFYFIHNVAKKNSGQYENEDKIVVQEHQIFKPIPGFNSYRLSELGSDFAIIFVERLDGQNNEKNVVEAVKVENMKGVEGDKTANANKAGEDGKAEGKVRQEQIYSIGHGLGLPLKFSLGGNIKYKNIEKKTPYFEAKVPLLGGNSGSPIFNSSHQCIGMYVRGVKKFKTNKYNKLILKKENDSFEGHECQKWDTIEEAYNHLIKEIFIKEKAIKSNKVVRINRKIKLLINQIGEQRLVDVLKKEAQKGKDLKNKDTIENIVDKLIERMGIPQLKEEIEAIEKLFKGRNQNEFTKFIQELI